jgi:metal-responsive CopG/Arc/MetJ family transcriptional regulator
MRTIIDLPNDQIKKLAALGKRERVSRAELVRRAVAQYLSRHQPTEADSAFGIWRRRGEDGLTYQHRHRHEWDR